jgi:4-carboxymuconolactone decarboxylase
MDKHKEWMNRGHKLLKQMGREGLLDDQKAISPALYEMTVGHLFGNVWTRPHLDLKTRQMITLATNIALARTTGNHSHYHSALHIGITKEEIIELIIQVGMYAGWPTIGLALRQFRKVLESEGSKKAKRNAKQVTKLGATWDQNPI